MNYERNIAGMKFAHPVMNGPGVNCKSLDEAVTLAESLSSGIVVGAFTKMARSGNPGDTAYFDIPELSVNALGMPNPGMAGLEAILPKMVKISRAAGKPIGVNIAGFSDIEFVELAKLVEDCGADWVELNLSCPNVHDGNELFCHSLGTTEKIVRGVMGNVSIPVDVKLSPFIDIGQKEDLEASLRGLKIKADLSECNIFESSYAYNMAELLRDLNVNIVTLCNTLGNVLIFKENGEPAIRTKVGDKQVLVGGMGGPIMKPIVISFVSIFRRILRPNQGIMAIGGVQRGLDVIEYECAGADMVQASTVRALRGERAIETIITEYVSLKESN